MDIDRQTSYGLFNFSASYIKCAEAAIIAKKNKTINYRFNDPLYFLLFHACELVLKAYMKEKTGAFRRSHNLKELLNDCIQMGLDLSEEDENSIIFFNECNSEEDDDKIKTGYVFRYIKTGSRVAPELSSLLAWVISFYNKIQIHMPQQQTRKYQYA